MKHNDREKFKPTCLASPSRPLWRIYSKIVIRLGVLCSAAKKKTMFNLWFVAYAYAATEYITTRHYGQTAMAMMTIAVCCVCPYVGPYVGDWARNK